MARHNNLGERGEALAEEYLIDKGYKILDKNWTFKHLEIDIVAQKYDFLSIIEVKTRSSIRYGYPESFVSQKKMQNIINATDEYLKCKGLEDMGVRFEVIAITKLKEGFSIEHFEDAFNSSHAFGLSPY